MADTRTADERYFVNPNDYANDPHYSYRPLAAHAAAIRREATTDRVRARRSASLKRPLRSAFVAAA